jgi:membrane-bound ClpP family serine protease
LVETMLNRFLFIASLLAVLFPAWVMLFFLLKLLSHSRRTKLNPSAAGLIGLTGRAESEIADEGLIFVRGELWKARSKIKIQRGTNIRVTGFYELALEVEII